MVDTTASGELVGTSTGAIANTRDVSPTPEELSVHDDVPLHDHVGLALDSSAPMVAFNARCQAALKETIWRERRGVVWPHLYADALGGVQLGARARADDPRIVYFIGLTRKSAAIMVSRLLLALYHHSHLFLVHLDLKADSAVVSELAALIKDHPNIHLMQTRRLVQWGAWTMNLILLDALHSAVSASIDFDFVINLSDVDVALRTNDEIVSFLRQYKGRQFVQVHQGSGEWLDKAKKLHCQPQCHRVRRLRLRRSQLHASRSWQWTSDGFRPRRASSLCEHERSAAQRSASGGQRGRGP